MKDNRISSARRNGRGRFTALAAAASAVALVGSVVMAMPAAADAPAAPIVTVELPDQVANTPPADENAANLDMTLKVENPADGDNLEGLSGTLTVTVPDGMKCEDAISEHPASSDSDQATDYDQMFLANKAADASDASVCDIDVDFSRYDSNSDLDAGEAIVQAFNNIRIDGTNDSGADFTGDITMKFTVSSTAGDWPGSATTALMALSTVTFEANGHGSAPASLQVPVGDKATPLADPSVSGYTFTGWYTDAGLANKFSFTTPVTEDLTLYAGWEAVTCHPFPSVDSSNVHCRNVEWLKEQGITKPIGGTYMPDSAVTRGAMATFLYRVANDGAAVPACTAKPFTDVDTDYVHCGAIQWAVDNHIAYGYGDGTYHPTSPVTRGAMATFLDRVANDGAAIPACTAKPFTDVDMGYVHCGAIDWAKAQGITTGLSGGEAYGPIRSVNRASMASFLHRLYNHMQ